MPKYCPNCGAELEFQDASFCSDCGYALKKEVSQRVEQENTAKEARSKINITELGNKLEEVVEKIFQTEGFRTERRKKLEGKSGTLSEIDIIANKTGRTIAIECKNYAEPIGIEKVRDFSQKLQDLGYGWRGIFVSYSGFTEGAAQLAQYQNIETWDHDEISEKWLAISIGRGASHRGQSLTLEYALALKVGFVQATALQHLNKDKIRVANAELIYHPYFAVGYRFKAQVRDPTKESHKLEDQDTLFIDAIDNHVLNPMPEKGLGILKKALKSVISKKARAENDRSKKLIHELRQGKPLREYSLNIEDEYTVTKLEPITTPREAIKSCINFVVEKNTTEIEYFPKTKDDTSYSKTIVYVPRGKDISITHKDIVVVPRWSIDFDSFGMNYKREILAWSGTPLEDTLTYCPEHLRIGALTLLPKKAIAVCEVCGKSLCDDHVKQCPICNKWLCHEHGADCEACRNRFCNKHLTLICPICGGSVCEACATSCPICGKRYGNNHTVRCDRCGTLVCPTCITTTGVIRKNRICKRCAP